MDLMIVTNSPPPSLFRLSSMTFFEAIDENVIELSESEILNDGYKTIVPRLSEGASCPLISEKSPEVRKEAIQQKVKYWSQKNRRSPQYFQKPPAGH